MMYVGVALVWLVLLAKVPAVVRGWRDWGRRTYWLAIFCLAVCLTADRTPVYWALSRVTGVPNLVWVFGYFRASWTLRADLVADFVCRLLAHMRARGHAVVVPDGPPEGPVGLPPLIDLRAGYVLRAADLLPRRGLTGPWRMVNSYPHDVLTLRHGRVDDGHLRFSAAPVLQRQDAA